MTKENLTSEEHQVGQAKSKPVPPVAEKIMPDPRKLTPATAAVLQRTVGNQAIGRLVGHNHKPVQAKMTLNAVNDPYEQEADSVAQQVVGQLNNPIQRQEDEDEIMTKQIQRQEDEDEIMTKRIQRQEDEDELMTKSIQRQEDEDEIIAKSIQQQEDEDEIMAKSASTHEGGEVAADVESRIQQAQGGQPLGDGVRQPMEQAFGADFSNVRIHTNSEANGLNQSLQARAFTTGQGIFFKEGEYNPINSAGQELLAHELTHVVQQNGRGSQKISRWSSHEHIELGDQGIPIRGIFLDSHKDELPEYRENTISWPYKWRAFYSEASLVQRQVLKEGLTYGEIVALSGDFYESFEDLNQAPLLEILELIPLIHATKPSTNDLQTVTGGRYLHLAKKNISHFSDQSEGNENNIDMWKGMHIDAINAARLGNPRAWAINAAADHFLTDAFSGGHIRTQRATLSQQGDLGHWESLARHNIDNRGGVLVENGDGPWVAFGDDHLSTNPYHVSLIKKAVESSKQDIEEAISEGLNYPEPSKETKFNAEELVPFSVDPNDISKTDVYSEMMNIAFDEGGEYIRGKHQDDDEVRLWVHKHKDSLSKISIDEKRRMIEVLLSGVISDPDFESIEVIWKNITNSDEEHIMREYIESKIVELGALTELRIRKMMLTSTSKLDGKDYQEEQEEMMEGQVISLPAINITGDPHFYTRALRANSIYARNPPLPGWPYDDILRQLWQQNAFDDFADQVRDIQEQELGLFGKSADGILGPQTARLINNDSKIEEPVQPAPQSEQSSKEERMVYIMSLLVYKYNYPENGAAGLVGNLYAESGLLANRIEGSKADTPLRDRDAQEHMTDFTAEDVMNRKYKVQGPKKPGVGLAQWTTQTRREGLFKHKYNGVEQGANILFNLDAQVDYLVTELQSKYKRVNKVLKDPSSSVADASDEVLFNFERPGKVLKVVSGKKKLRSRDDPKVQGVLEARRNLGESALGFFQEANTDS